ncbi:MAG TPA: hypothetical protein VE057_09555 [Archangium sp.]|nr:hypothetical protein [Archangium sp.]
MHHTMKMTLAALVSLVGLPTAAHAATVKAPYSGVVSIGYTSSGVDIASGSCNYWGVETGLVGSVYWNVTIRTTNSYCNTGSGSGTQNEAAHVFPDGWMFRLWHFNKTAASVDKTCDRCQIGDEGSTGNSTGAHTRLIVSRNGTMDTSWYQGYVVNGQRVDRTTTIGVF